MACDIDDVMDLDPEFPQFSKLPKEIRDEIWSYSFSFILPRTIELVDIPPPKPLKWCMEKGITTEPNVVAAKKAPVPPIFQVCYESRERAMKECPIEFGGLITNGPIFFDFEKDTLLFATLDAFLLFARMSITQALSREDEPEVVDRAVSRFEEKIRHMAIKDCIWDNSDVFFEQLFRLKTLTLLEDVYRWWPLYPGFSEISSFAPTQNLPDESARLLQEAINEGQLRAAWAVEAATFGLKLEKPPRIEYKNLDNMKPSIG